MPPAPRRSLSWYCPRRRASEASRRRAVIWNDAFVAVATPMDSITADQVRRNGQCPRSSGLTILAAGIVNPELRGHWPFLLTWSAVMLSIGVATATNASFQITALRREASEARRLGQYQLKERLGAGGMGEVYLAEHRLLKRPCAVKLI